MMSPEHIIIGLYLRIEAFFEEVLDGHRLRFCGRRPQLTDAEVLTLEIFGEMQGHHTDAAIWRYAHQHWLAWFPKLSSYKAFVKQCANLVDIKKRLLAYLFPMTANVHITDGVPIPICHLARARRDKCFKGEASYGFCAAKNEKYYGFKGHVVINLAQRIVGFTLTAANVDEREVLATYAAEIKGLMIGDKGLLSKSLQEDLANHGLDLQTPLRDNMEDTRSETFVSSLLKTRRRVETVIGQLTDHFDLTRCKARDTWHLASRHLRKILAYNLKLEIC
jgi:Transposase DDE domain